MDVVHVGLHRHLRFGLLVDASPSLPQWDSTSGTGHEAGAVGVLVDNTAFARGRRNSWGHNQSIPHLSHFDLGA